MIKFKGRSSLKQYLPKKPIKRGFKVWVRADSWNGSDFEVYTWKEESAEVALGSKVVKKLSGHLSEGGTMCNSITSFHLFLFDNLKDNLYACATFRKDRKRIPNAIAQTTLGMLQVHTVISAVGIQC